MVALAQPAEHRIVDPKVMGSTPIGHPKSAARAMSSGVLWNRKRNAMSRHRSFATLSDLSRHPQAEPSGLRPRQDFF